MYKLVLLKEDCGRKAKWVSSESHYNDPVVHESHYHLSGDLPTTCRQPPYTRHLVGGDLWVQSTETKATQNSLGWYNRRCGKLEQEGLIS